MSKQCHSSVRDTCHLCEPDGCTAEENILAAKSVPPFSARQAGDIYGLSPVERYMKTFGISAVTVSYPDDIPEACRGNCAGPCPSKRSKQMDVETALRLLGNLEANCKDPQDRETAGEVANVMRRLRRATAGVQVLVDALEKLARLGNGDQYGNSVGNIIAQDALAAYTEGMGR